MWMPGVRRRQYSPFSAEEREGGGAFGLNLPSTPILHMEVTSSRIYIGLQTGGCGLGCIPSKESNAMPWRRERLEWTTHLSALTVKLSNH